MHDPRHESTTTQQQTPTSPVTGSARYAAGPSKGRTIASPSAPGVAEGLGHQGAPEEEAPGTLPRAAEAAALHRVARRRRPDPDGQRKQRVDARYSVAEKNKILTKARSLNVSGAYLVGAAVMAYIDGDLTLPGQRTQLDDYIDELTALRAQVAKIGHNVNQIARKLNSGGDPHPGDNATLAHTERTLHAVRATIGEIATTRTRRSPARRSGDREDQ